MKYRVMEHNREVRANAEYRAREMRIYPTPLEEKMIAFLEENWINYECQKIFYIVADDGWIIRYYIADFYIPDQKLIIEVDGKFHDEHKQHDKMRTRTIQEQYPDVEVLRFKWDDLSDRDKMDELLWRLRQM